jgi:VWFA-related protein
VRRLAAVCLLLTAIVWVGPSHVRVQAGRADDGASSGDALIRVTAVVTDRKGQPLSGLRPADFELLVDGKPQAIETVELRKADAPPPRTVALLLDEFHTAEADSAPVRDILLRFVNRLRNSDQVMVVKPLDTLSAIRPTTDREAVRAAITTFEGRKGDYAARTAFEREYMAQAPSAVAAARGQIVTAALRSIAMSLADQNAAGPVIVLVGDGFARMRSSREMPANLQTAIRIANRADAPVYAFAPALVAPAPDAEEPPDPAFVALRALTADTGGAFVAGLPGIEEGLMRMRRELDAHYVLTYRPAHGSDGRFHELRVGLKKTGAEVKARKGYVAPMSAAMRAAVTPRPAAPLRILRRSTLIQSWAWIVPTTPGNAGVTLTWAPVRPDSGARARAVSLVVTASSPDGALLFDGVVGPVGSAPKADVPVQAAFEAPAGHVRVDIKILDDKGVVIDTDARDVSIPVPRANGPTLYPPAVLTTQSAREFRDISTNPQAPPVPRREFRRTERLLIRASAVDPSGASIPVSAALLNRLRQPMQEIAAMRTDLPPGINQFDLPLAALAPGDYAVRLTATAPSGTAAEYVTFRIIG